MVRSLSRVSVSLKRDNQRSLRWKSLDRHVKITVENRLGDKRRNRKGTWRWRLVIFLRRREWIYASYLGNAWGNVSTIVYSSQTTFFPRGRIFRSSMHLASTWINNWAAFYRETDPLFIEFISCVSLRRNRSQLHPHGRRFVFWSYDSSQRALYVLRSQRKKRTNSVFYVSYANSNEENVKKRGNFSLRFFRIVAQSTKSCTKIEKKKEKKNEEIQRWLNLQEFIGWFSAEWRMAKNVEEIFSHVGARWVLPTSRRSFVWKISWKTCLCGDNTTSRVEVPV